jgi:TolB-like protein/DNA-binding winged helix-turn-helix (wHTH) protein/tetratricopeptide (TPR) repeat protein
VGTDFRVGAWLVRPSLNTVCRNGASFHLQPKAMEVLVSLARQPGEVLPKDQLLKTVWADTFVTDDVLIRSISELRRVFEDDARQPTIIQTIPKRGYRLVAPVEPADGTTGIPAVSEGSRADNSQGNSTRDRWLGPGAFAGAALLLVLLIASSGKIHRWLSAGSGSPSIHSIAVLPLQNLSGDDKQEYLSDGVTDLLITDLAQISSLKVISRTSTMLYQQTKKTLPEIAHELNVDGIVEGTVLRSGDRVRITAQLIYAPSDRHVWANSYERDVRDILALERDVTGDIARQVQARLSTQSRVPTAEPQVTNPIALEAYLQGNYHLKGYFRGSGDEEKRKAAEYFQQAIDADPTFAAAYVGMTWAHRDLLWPSSRDVEIFKRSVARAVELDPSSSDAHHALGVSKWSNWEWSGAEEEYRRAIALSPNSADAHNSLCWLLFSVGRADEGFRECQMAQELDPGQDHLAEALYLRGDYDHAISLIQMMLQRDPDNVYEHDGLYESYAVKGMQEESLKELAKAFSLFGMPQAAARIQHASEVSGYFVGFRQAAKEVEDLQSAQQAYAPVNLALIYTILGDKDRAFYWLEHAYEHHDRHWLSIDMSLDWLRIDPLFKPLRTDPRYVDLLRRIGLPP